VQREKSAARGDEGYHSNATKQNDQNRRKEKMSLEGIQPKVTAVTKLERRITGGSDGQQLRGIMKLRSKMENGGPDSSRQYEREPDPEWPPKGTTKVKSKV